MNLLLDTSIFLWYITGDKKLPKKYTNEIQNKKNNAFLSVASFWECIIKQQIGKLDLSLYAFLILILPGSTIANFPGNSEIRFSCFKNSSNKFTIYLAVEFLGMFRTTNPAYCAGG